MNSRLSQNVQRGKYVHMRGGACHAKVDSFLVTTRNPIQRFKSLFYYEKINKYPVWEEEVTAAKKENLQVDRRRERFVGKQTRGAIYVDCYSHLEDLAVKGLGTNITGRRVPSTVKNMTCPQRAWAMVMGARRLGTHAWFNYEYYFTDVINKYQPMPIFALRNEHLAEDWDSIHNLLGAPPQQQPTQHLDDRNLTKQHKQDDTNPPGSVVFNEMKVRVSIKKQGSGQPLSEIALQHLCQALCVEIQYYKQILQSAVNINATQYLMAMLELQHDCPNEPVHIRSCARERLPKFPRQAEPFRLRGHGKVNSVHLWK
ncbi:hypothetical protein ACA910_020093 [Epithemia clementina (nom. ined.)]